ncbi:MAG: Rpn family recombination-promoting nuclease/putative transposase [Bryobacterales bacterium]|nr:Rpn family recombination-promoting nuclease/putative transposase [Bryobacterales bacterium]
MTAVDQGLRRDSAFKLFVHHQSFIRHLLRAYPLAGIDEREVVAIEAGNANLVAAGGQGQRLADAVWRLTLADGEIAYLLIECQAEIDPSMPFRMLHAVAGMYLIQSQNPLRESGYAAGWVPRVKHLIIYSGKRPWTAAEEVGQAIRSRSLQEERDIPRMECPVLELWRCEDPGGEENLAVLLGRLQRCDSPEALRAAAEPLKRWPDSESQGALGRAFAVWISEVLIPDLGVPDATKGYDLRGVLDMLETESLTWADRMRAEGREQGREQGRDEGRREGERKLLLRQARIRFGEALARSLATRLEGIADAERLEEIGEWLLVCDSGDALLARLGQH